MELTKQCVEKIMLAALEVDNGTLTITIQARPEDEKSFDIKCDYTKRFRVSRKGQNQIPTETARRQFPPDKIK